MKEKLVRLLVEANGQFLSGEKISEQLNCSRTAVWKHIESLRQDGYELESAPRKGYRFISQPDQIKAHDIKIHLHTDNIGQTIHYYEQITTTQKAAMKLAQEGAGDGELVISNHQTEGKGRLGRVWETEQQKAITMSLILKPKIHPTKVPQLTLLAAVAVSRALQQATKLPVTIKWPNDLLINGKKLVGILTEMQAEPERVSTVIVGIGINVNQSYEDFHRELQEKATSLLIASDQSFKRSEIVAAVLNEFERLYDQYLSEGFAPIKALWEDNAESIGKQIIAHTAQGSYTGYAKGITDDGVLELVEANGQIRHIYSADIEIPSIELN
ncbi:biotin--[acetyl-CoA-carboxylase] ligase [Alkalihalobacillus pseudalcaliphilus]|uniref:biotin--[acetyl-CoA-carboxylase] ligase n=1 Tax=Alkalihalobacillus pseudalcaliphilus TaxID=79884 RepID=UPI00064DA5DB|nr:biotin--[acetyl-CoA-carboxylase] ligase [Alkalihalobacillus pseudalcaliphilus]KMK76413.1 biotin--acetyl-CoA-carboxylase ligase [Alkalihalobacillus pseudalcaliphilus]